MTKPNKKPPSKISNTSTNPIGNLLRKAQNKLESSVSSSDHNEAVLQQSQVWVKAVTWGLIGTTVFGIAWLAIARTEEVVVATGKLEPVGNVKEIRVPMGAVVEEILVKNGEQVSKDQALILLDQESTAEQLKSLEQGLKEKTSQINQKKEQLSLKKLERDRTLDLNREQLATTRDNLGLETQILNRLQGLAREGATADIQYLQQLNKVAGLKGDLIKLELEGKRQINQIDQQIEQINAELAGLRSERSQLNAKITEVRVTNKNQTLRAPVSGIVFDLKLNNPGYISQSQSSQAVLKVVPFNAVEADVEIPSNKIGFVRIGQAADISIDSFPASDFGVLEGTVQSVGSDALPPDQQRMRQTYAYPAVIKLDSQQLKIKNGKTLPLQVGMSLTANIKLRSVSYLQLLLNTFQTKTDSLRQL
ncbi:type I secretion system ABC transporter/ HlyD family [Synechococcus sp. SYN20]|uniref:HlyD family secretion protein n=1 Tax=Synechococcus sp. SYN20 TaxID=1050714 RepID=UPI001645F2DA|nr:HlyD family efflux transporter periplasmic adaptor subunit [Synechococcus sp. SYN20]QNJ27639.1 type I secretion system ABC transporter/ HlyD family [Synechococcus sp. SYN20]